MGIASLVLGIISVLIAWHPCCTWISWITSITGLVLGIVALCLSKKQGKGKGMPIVGIVLSVVSWFEFPLLIALGLAAAAANA